MERLKKDLTPEQIAEATSSALEVESARGNLRAAITAAVKAARALRLAANTQVDETKQATKEARFLAAIQAQQTHDAAEEALRHLIWIEAGNYLLPSRTLNTILKTLGRVISTLTDLEEMPRGSEQTPVLGTLHKFDATLGTSIEAAVEEIKHEEIQRAAQSKQPTEPTPSSAPLAQRPTSEANG